MTEDQKGYLLLGGGLLALAAVWLFATHPELIVPALVVIAIGWWIFSEFFEGFKTGKGGQRQTKSANLGASSRHLEFEVAEVSRSISGLRISILEFRVRGLLSGGQVVVLPRFEVHMEDVTRGGGAALPVLSALEHWQSHEDSTFELAQDLECPLSPGAGSLEWITIGGVPIEILGFPYGGQRSILVRLCLRDLATDQVVAHVECRWLYDCDQLGYAEEEETESEAQGYTIKLALWTAAADGSTDDKEIQTIKEWGSRASKTLDDSRREGRKSMLNSALQDATHMIRSNRASELESEVIGWLRDNASLRQQYDAYELCLDVAKADGVADPEEMALLSRIAEGLGLDESRAKVLLDRNLADVDLGGLEGSSTDADKLIGITDAMSKEEIRKHLIKLFRKWQGRQASDDRSVRGKAEEWLEMITEARKRHLG